MYLVVHDDRARGEAIVAALGGEPAARLVEDVASLYRQARDHGKPAAALIATDASGASWTRLTGLEGVPILYDGGSSAAVYRAFAVGWEPGQPFHHLTAASPEEAARALGRLAAEGAHPAPRAWWRAITAMGWLGILVLPVRKVVHALLPAGGQWPLVEGLILAALLLATVLMVGLPVQAALARGIRPTKGAVAKVAFVAVYAPLMIWLLLREAMSVGS